MYLLDNPVLQRELLVNLRMHRGFVLLLSYMALLGVVVYGAWPSQIRLDLTTSPEEAKNLVDMFFLGQYILVSLMAPSFAAGAVAGEKERKTYEMLLASPMKPGAIVLGKLLASMSHLAVLVFCSLPIVMLCLPLGGKSLWEVLATYTAMSASVLVFGMISLTASCYFNRTIASQLVSYMLILPLALMGMLFYMVLEESHAFGLVMLALVFPAACLAVSRALMRMISTRLMHPPDVGSDAQDVIDLEDEQREAVGMVIRSDQFPDRLFAPRRRAELMADRANPVYDKEMRSELFGHGTLMLRLVIQLSMGLALVVMAICLYIQPEWAPWYTSYVLLFNMLVGPVFSAGMITNERERQTLELLLTTTLSPWQILSGKLVSSLRISVVLTSFLIWPLLLAWLLPPWTYWQHTLTMFGYLLIIAVTCLSTTTIAMFCSVVFRKTTVSMMTAYLVILTLFVAPVAVKLFTDVFSPAPAAVIHEASDGRISDDAEFRLTGPGGQQVDVPVTAGETLERVAEKIQSRSATSGVKATAEGDRLLIGPTESGRTPNVRLELVAGRFPTRVPTVMRIRDFLFVSPFAAAFSLPLDLDDDPEELARPRIWSGITAPACLAFYLGLDLLLVWIMLGLFRVRWRVRYY